MSDDDGRASDHNLREAGQLLVAHERVEAVDIVSDGGIDPALEATLSGGDVPPSVLSILAGFGVALDPDATATRGNPVHTRLVARP
jgi:hypothetical protein